MLHNTNGLALVTATREPGSENIQYIEHYFLGKNQSTKNNWSKGASLGSANPSQVRTMKDEVKRLERLKNSEVEKATGERVSPEQSEAIGLALEAYKKSI